MLSEARLKEFYKDKKCVVLGGTGFIGLNLTKALVKIGAQVSVGYLNNQKFDSEQIRFIKTNILDSKTLNCLDEGNIVFHLAGISGTVESNISPVTNLEVNGRGVLNILERLKEKNPKAVVFFPSSQQVYGSPKNLPVKETDLLQPLNIYGAHKLLVENYLKIYEHLYGIRSVVFRLPNPYGPGQRGDKSYGVVGKFIELAKKNEEIKIFGKGEQKRDFIYIDDAIEAMLSAVVSESCYGEVFNVGGIKPVSVSELVQTIVSVVGSGTINFVPWPAEAKKAELGDIYLSYDKIASTIGWKPKTSLEEGIKLSL